MGPCSEKHLWGYTTG